MKYLKESSRVNPYDLGSVAKITQAPIKNTFGTARSNDVRSAGGKNSSVGSKNYIKPKSNKF